MNDDPKGTQETADEDEASVSASGPGEEAAPAGADNVQKAPEKVSRGVGLVSRRGLFAPRTPPRPLAIGLSFIELLIQVLQAYVFTVLTANYIGGALSEDH